MKIDVDRRMLEIALTKISGAVHDTGNMPILGNVLLDFDGTLLRLVGTDLEITIETKIPARGITWDKITVSAKKLLAIARHGAGDYISMEIRDEKILLVKLGKTKFELHTLAADDFPFVDMAMGAGAATFESFVLVRALGRVLHAVPSSGDTYSIPGAYLHEADTGFRFAVTDGHRLSYAGCAKEHFPGFSLENHSEGKTPLQSPHIIIPGEAARQIVKLLDKTNNAKIELDGQKIRVNTGDTTLSCLLLDAKFPEYSFIIPDNLPFSIAIPRDELILVLKRISAMLTKTLTFVRLIITKEGLELRAGSLSEEGEASDFITVDYEDEDFSIALKLEFLQDVAAASSAEKIIFSWVDDHHAAIFTEEGSPDVLDLIMPMVV